MTEEKAIELATQYQKEDGRPTKLLGVRKITQAQIDAFEEAHGKKDPSERPEWMRLEPHWVVAFDREWGGVPSKYLIKVYDDGYITETPSM